MYIDVSKRRVGVIPVKDGQTLINVWAPLAQKISLVIPGNGYLVDLEKKPLGYWTGKTEQLKPGERYKFIIDNNKHLPDPVSLSQPDGVHESSAVVDLAAHRWTDLQWKNIPLEQYIIYELHTGTFTA